ncbi:16S rRNA (guanine(966)-N(2))-methyltransferase RsmD [Marivivens donghaensis]|uniref:16S rRNA (Guanine(966)-N(2))-methyltransferase RsmD n=1 Tax=Marivivens donghaensis TaxID=1699413 RepID=A0ABX0VWJ1_9RHOB|nr:16S rRNA (guanine(966)-N(2))-methyltransferase RsmD [Marivivens donghaensis]
MRIIGGAHRGLALASVGKGDPGAHLRPTTDRVRESLFNVLMGGRFGDPISDAVVLDLFAGTGALGLEAISRGASHVTFVDDGRVAQKLIRENIAKCKRQADTTIVVRNATKLGPCTAAPASLVFLDPPYGMGLGMTALTNAKANGWIADEALIVFEESAPQLAPEGFEVLNQRRYGDTHVTFLESI